MKTIIHLVSSMMLVVLASCNPIPFDPTSAPMIAFPPMPIPAPLIVGAAPFDPASYMHPHPQFILSPHHPFGSQQPPQPPSSPQTPPAPFEQTRRRSLAGLFRPVEKSSNNKSPSNDQNEMTDEQKVLGDLPVSFIEPEGPSTIPERISDSFSALGEGVRNHFRSISENFSDTMDDIKDAWRSSDHSKKRG